jgi:hypothetical protein
MGLVREGETMAEQPEQTWEQELLARGEAIGLARAEARGLERGERLGELKAYRKVLRKFLERRFQTLPDDVLQGIAFAELPALKAAFQQVDTIPTLEDLQRLLPRYPHGPLPP